MRGKNNRLFVVPAMWLLCAVSARGGLVIDDFSDVSTSWPVTISSPNVVVRSETNLSGVIGGTRVATLSAFVFDVEGLDQVRATIAPQFGVLDYASSVGADGDLRLSYVGEFQADLSGDAFIQVDFAGFDMGGNVPLAVTVELGHGALTATLTQMLNGVGSQSLAFNFSEFIGIDAVDLASISAMEFRFNPGAGGDFRIGGISSVVPEPTTLVMLIAGAGAILFRRRTRA
ncbi:MAG: PEP-CTERM sorting domain-containing protein [Planctomycetes bacterium]|nr:PEP-CTERM sorting domain-containing protein [Planctomycetota bacterium]